MAIDIGSEAINRANAHMAGYTILITQDNPANSSGTIDTIEIYAATTLYGCVVGSFYLVSGTTYKCRDKETIGTVTSGSKQTYSGLSLTVQVGDILGVYYSGGNIEFDIDKPGKQVCRKSGNKVTVDLETDFNTVMNNDEISLYGTGMEPSSSSSSRSSLASSSHSSSSRSSSHSSSSHSSSSHSSHSSSSHSSSSHSSSSLSSSSSSNTPIASFPTERPVGYDPDLVFDDVTGTWVSDEELLAKGGSRYRSQFVAVGMDLIYYEEFS